MEPWPPVLVALWRFVLIPFALAIATAGLLAGLNVLSKPARVDPEFGVFVIAVLVINYLVYRLEAHARRIDVLEKKLNALQPNVPNSAPLNPDP